MIGDDGKTVDEDKEPTENVATSPEWKLNLSQMQTGLAPRVHWAISPLAKGSASLQEANENEPCGSNNTFLVSSGSSSSLKERDLQFGMGLQRRAERLLDLKKQDTRERKGKLPKALTGLLKSKSTTCSPLASHAAKLPRVYASPISSQCKEYVATNEPSSSSQPRGEESSPLRKILRQGRSKAGSLLSSPVRKKQMQPPVVLQDIEDAIGGLGSSFFSDGELGKRQGKDDFGEEGLDLDAFDFFEPICDQAPQTDPAGPIHRRIQVQSMRQAGQHVQLNGIDLHRMTLVEVQVHGEWLRCLGQVSESSPIVHIISEDLIVDDEHGFLVTNPDTLVSATLVADSITCPRRAVLSTRLQASVEDNKPNAALICGSIVHEIIEQSLLSQRNDAGFLEGLIPAQMAKAGTSIFCAGVEEAKIEGQVREILRGFPDWAQSHLHEPADEYDCVINDKVSISKVLRCEENVWSHAFGIKGKIDGTVLMRRPEDGQLVLAPLELKTGHSTTSVAHRAQCLLYAFMLWDRYRAPVPDALLFYVAKGSLFRLHPSRADLRGLVITRNGLAAAVGDRSALPPLVSNKHLCKGCFQLESCTLAHRILEGGNAETAPIAEHFVARTGHINASDNSSASAFFAKWERLVWLEEVEAQRGTRELWSMTAKERELCGRCIGDLRLVSCDPVTEADASAFAGFVCRFERPAIGDVLQRSQLAEGDPIVVSSMERGHFGLAIGFLSSLDDGVNALSVIVDRPLEIGGAIDRFRIDKDELSASFGLLRTNLLKLFAPEQERLMRLIVKLEAPQFELVSDDIPIPGHLQEAYQSLDTCQREVISRAMATKDYLLVLGMPGTGKSTTLALLIRLLIARGKSILLTSHTHSAVDNILLKLTNMDGVRFCRLGNPEKIPPVLHHSVFERQKFKSLQHLESFFMGAPLVACTTLAVNKALLGKRSFDVCIVDEASQISVPACVGPLRFARSFLLVGDHYQLPPLVRSKQATAEGLQKSLFAMLADAHPQAVAMLRLQYRMNADIMAISNRFVYADMLVCGSDAVAMSRLPLPKLGSFQCVLCGSGPSCWLRQVLDPSRTVLFLNTDDINAYEVASGNSFQNPAEAAIVHALLSGLLSSGAAQEDLTVISPYRPQLKLLADPAAFPAVPMATVDKFQGRDAACVLISLVRSNPEHRLGALLKDWSRLNVAFTRAKAKLVLVGSLATMASDGTVAGLCDMFQKRGWIYTVPLDHADHHALL